MKRLTDDEHDYTLHSWSPDGKYLAVSTDWKVDRDFSFQSDLYLFHLETGELKQVNGEPGYYGEASWSPDGMRLAYIGHSREFENATHNKIWIHEPATGHSLCLTEGMDVPVGDYLNSDSIQGSSRTGIQWSKDNESFYFLASDREIPSSIMLTSMVPFTLHSYRKSSMSTDSISIRTAKPSCWP